MTEPLKLMCILAHPDDESTGTGGVLAKYAAEGVETYVITATRGERGWMGDEKDNPGMEALGKIREAELEAAARVLGLHRVAFLDYVDGDLDQADPAEAVGKIISHIRRIRPQVVITFDPMGSYGHPDHVAICQFTSAAIVHAASISYVDAESLPPHIVSKLYYMVDTKEIVAEYLTLGDMVMNIDGVERRPAPWEDWAITTRIDAEAHWQTVIRAINCHRSQYGDMFRALTEEQGKTLGGRPTFYRALSLVNGGRNVEHDLFEGLR